jgi:hypothetical protein
MMMTIEIASKLPVMHAAGDALMALLDSEDAGTASNARQCLRNVVEHLVARKLVEAALTPAGTEQYLGTLPSAPPDFFYKVHAVRS